VLRTIKDLEGYALHATDGKIGHVKDFYFDDKAWVIRYLVVETGSWLSSRKVLISPYAIGRPDWEERTLPVAVTMAQVKASPDIDTHQPISRQHEILYLRHYGYPFYWGGAGLWGGGSYPAIMVPDYQDFTAVPPTHMSDEQRALAMNEKARHRDDDPHLRDCNTVLDYHVQATDGDIGHVEGLLVDDETWALRYLVVNTSNWWLGHKVLVAPAWIRDVSWQDATVSLDVTQKAVQDAPTYDTDAPLLREGESGLYRHFERQGYWLAESENDAREAVLKVPLQVL
jgi:hypothetical protein